MPRIRQRDVESFLTWLVARGIPVSRSATTAGSLKDSHAEVDQAKVREILAKAAADPVFATRKLAAPIFVSLDGFVIDGQHRAAALLSLGPSTPVQVIVIGAELHQLVPLVARFPKASFADLSGFDGGARTAVLGVGGRLVRAEVVSSPEDVRKGLSGRTWMAEDAGMLFAFEEPGVRPFWMAGTTIPLVALFLRNDGTVASMSHMEPLTLDQHVPTEPVQLVLEVRPELAASARVRPGSVVVVAPRS